MAFVALLLAIAAISSEAFAPLSSSVLSSQHQSVVGLKATPMLMEPLASVASASSLEVSAITLDPTTVFSDLLAGLIGTPAILLVPILAALGVASLIAWLIVSYANPEVEDDE